MIGISWKTSTRRSWYLLCGMVWTVTACGPSPSDPIGDNPTVIGQVTRIESRQAGLRVLVEEDPDVQDPLQTGGTKVWFSISTKTLIYDGRGGTIRRVTVDGVQIDQIVEASYEGWMLDSYPGQTGATALVIIGEK